VIDEGFAFPTGGRIGEDVIAWCDLAARYVFLGIDEPLSVVEWSAGSAALNLDKQIIGKNGMLDVLSAHELHGKQTAQLNRLAGALHFIALRKAGAEGPIEPEALTVESPSMAGAWSLDGAIPMNQFGYTSYRAFTQ
jgi:hypothetical protein